eukprot:c6184_g1_i2.p1 GENE.c6184_g1_i2~~c6184_g1_i2.p1  ORF type:complete len:123 (-),score=13.13 c6184_g1_i2:310-678(-)
MLRCLCRDLNRRAFASFNADSLWNKLRYPTITNNAFEIFAVPLRYDIDLKQIERSFRQLQMDLHPDKVQTKSDVEKSEAESLSSAINEAYHLMKSPFLRANHMVHYFAVLRCLLFDFTIIFS